MKNNPSPHVSPSNSPANSSVESLDDGSCDDENAEVGDSIEDGSEMELSEDEE